MSTNVEKLIVANNVNKNIVKDTEFEPIVKKASKVRKIAYSIIKRAIDIIVGLIGTIALIPLTIIVHIARVINHENDGPIFYKQLRIGKNGKYFEIYKYRSMIIGADKILKTYLDEHEDAKREFEENHKLDNDPRITKVGKILRKTSLDEFPQCAINQLFTLIDSLKSITSDSCEVAIAYLSHHDSILIALRYYRDRTAKAYLSHRDKIAIVPRYDSYRNSMR